MMHVLDRKVIRIGLFFSLLLVLLAVPMARYALADQTVEVPITTSDFTGTTYSNPKSFTVDTSKISGAKQIFIEVSLSTDNDYYLRVLYIQIDSSGVNEKSFDSSRKMTAIVSPGSQNNLRYDVTSMVKGKNSVTVKIYLYHLGGSYTWHVSAKFVGVLSDNVVIPNPSGSSGESFAVPVYIASGGVGLALLAVAYVLKQRED